MPLRPVNLARVHERLVELHQLASTNSAGHCKLSTAVEQFITDYEHPDTTPDDHSRGEYLFQPDCRAVWQQHKQVYSGLFGNILADRRARALHGCCVAILQFAVEATTPRRKAKLSAKVSEAIADYLDHTGDAPVEVISSAHLDDWLLQFARRVHALARDNRDRFEVQIAAWIASRPEREESFDERTGAHPFGSLGTNPGIAGAYVALAVVHDRLLRDDRLGRYELPTPQPLLPLGGSFWDENGRLHDSASAHIGLAYLIGNADSGLGGVNRLEDGHRPWLEEQFALVEADLAAVRDVEVPHGDQPIVADPSPARIEWLGESAYRPCGGDPVAVEQSEHDVLQAFLAAGVPSLTTLDFKTWAKHVEEPGRVLRKLRTRYGGRFAEAVTTPGRRGKGGYVVHVDDRSQSAPNR